MLVGLVISDLDKNLIFKFWGYKLDVNVIKLKRYNGF